MGLQPGVRWVWCTLLLTAAVLLPSWSPLAAAAKPGSPPKATKRPRIKGLPYNPGFWNSSCRYQLVNVPPAEFFEGQASLDPSASFVPADNTKDFTKLLAYPLDACFGPTEKYNDGLVARGKRLPCKYSYTKKFLVNYWEEQPCPATLLANCYCYGLNKYKGGFCVPGGAAGFAVTNWTCPQLVKGIIRDGGRQVSYSTVLTKQPKGTHYIAAGITPPSKNTDYHIWRLDSNGAWSWKAGYTYARNTYPNGTLVRDIRDPKARKQHPILCGFFDVNAKTHKLYTRPLATNSPIQGRLALWGSIKKWKVRVVRLAGASKGWRALNKVYRGLF